MQSVSSTSRGFGHIFALCALLAVAGCQSTDTAGVLNPGGDEAAQAKITQDELRAFCPRATLREGTAYFSNYRKGGEEAPEKLVYRASISDITRACNYAGPTMTVNVAVAGRVVPGAASTGGTITLPIRVVAIQGEEVVYSQLYNHQVTLAAAGATQFVFNDPNVVVPQTGQRNIQVFAGFDEGPGGVKKRNPDDE